MAYDPGDADRIRRVLADRAVVEKSLIGGGLGFMVDGRLCCGISDRGLTVRVGADARQDALGEPHVRPLEVGNRQPKAFVVVEPDGFRDDAALTAWIKRGLQFVATLNES